MLGQGDERFAKLPFNPAAGKFTLCWVRETRMTLSLSVNSSILNCKSLSLTIYKEHTVSSVPLTFDPSGVIDRWIWKNRKSKTN